MPLHLTAPDVPGRHLLSQKGESRRMTRRATRSKIDAKRKVSPEELGPSRDAFKVVAGFSAPPNTEADIRELEHDLRRRSNRPISELFPALLQRIETVTGADGAVFALQDGKAIVCQASSGHAPEVGARLHDDFSLTRECFEKGETVVCEDSESDPRIPAPLAKTLHLRSAVIVPIKDKGAVRGVIEILAARPYAFGAASVVAVQRIAGALNPLLFPRATTLPNRLRGIAVLIAGLLAASLFGIYRAQVTSRRVEITAGTVPQTRSRQLAANRPSQSTSGNIARAPNIDANSVPRNRGTVSALVPNLHSSMPTLGSAKPRSSSLSPQPSKLSPKDTPPVVAPPAAKLELSQVEPLLAYPSVPTAMLSAPAIVRSLPRPEFALARTVKAHTGWVTGVAFSPVDERLVTGSWDGQVKLWDLMTGQQQRAVSGKTKQIQALAFSRNGRLLATEDYTNKVTLWDVATGAKVRTFAGEKSINSFTQTWVYSITFTPDGHWLASGLDDKTVRLWDVNTGQSFRDFTGRARTVIYTAISPDGHLLATGSDDKAVDIWDIDSGRKLRTLSGHKKTVNAVAFSPDGRHLASASVDKTVKVWDLANGHEILSLSGHRGPVSSLAFSPNSHLLASGSWDDSVKIWDAANGRELQTLAGNAHHIYTVAFDHSGEWFASGSENGTLLLWHVRSQTYDRDSMSK
jgi:WD40 repeat protein